MKVKIKTMSFADFSLAILKFFFISELLILREFLPISSGNMVYYKKLLLDEKLRAALFCVQIQKNSDAN